jgi:ADP-heptose:LPS heptosyltransferase
VSADSRPVLLVLRPLGLGDLLTAVPALRALASVFSEHRRLLAMPLSLAPLALHTRTIHAVLPVEPLQRIGGLMRCPDVAVDLHGRGPASQRILLATHPRHLVAFGNPAVPQTHGMPSWRDDEHEVTRWCRMLEGFGLAADPARLELTAPELAVPPVVRGATVIHPGAAYPARRWPAARFAAVARAEVGAGHPVVVTGGRTESALAATVAEAAGIPPQCVLAGRTSALQLAAVVAAAGRVVCNDTGIAHLATALGTPSVVLFGPTSPACWGPPADRPWHRALWHGRSGDPHGTHCDAGLLEIGIDEVVAALRAADATGVVSSASRAEGAGRSGAGR